GHGVLSYWINYNGKPINNDSYLPLIKKTVEKYLPNKKLTALDFRRIIPSLMYSYNPQRNEEPLIPEEQLPSFLKDYAGLVNTSESVLQRHYIRSTTLHRQDQVVNMLTENLFDTPKAKKIKRKLQENIKSSKQEVSSSSSSSDEGSDNEIPIISKAKR